MEIPYKEKPSEFEIQAYLYVELKNKGFNVRGCVPNARSRSRGKIERMIFDLVIFNDKNEAIEIIEVKDSKKHKKNTLQHKKYSSTGLPVLYARGMKEAKRLLRTRYFTSR